MYAIGEAAKGAKITADIIAAFVKKSTRPETTTSAFDNEFIQAYFSIISGILFVQTALFLMLPLYVNYTAGGFITGIIIAMMAVIIAISNISFFTGMFRAAVAITVIAYIVGLTFILFPQVGFYTGGITENIHVVPASTAQLINEYNDVKAKQIENIDNDCLKKGIAWQKTHPGEKPPQWFTEALAKKRALN